MSFLKDNREAVKQEAIGSWGNSTCAIYVQDTISCVPSLIEIRQVQGVAEWWQYMEFTIYKSKREHEYPLLETEYIKLW